MPLLDYFVGFLFFVSACCFVAAGVRILMLAHTMQKTEEALDQEIREAQERWRNGERWGAHTDGEGVGEFPIDRDEFID